ncbi:MAG: ORF6N domain-containing protein [Planctomycetota bacterium]|nr:ORF6N domain-containing protein [Planctomycetota bacterium]
MPGGKHEIVPVEQISRHILTIRGQKVMLDKDLAGLYGVEVRRLNEQVRRNPDRFPPEFMFQLTPNEFRRLRSQIAISKGRGGRRYLPYAFTEHGAIMLATVLNSPSAVAMSIQIVKAFVLMRRMIGAVSHLARKLDMLERKMVEHDKKFGVVFDAIRELMESPPEEPKGRIGFQHRD